MTSSDSTDTDDDREPDVVVRPIGYVEPFPVVRRIGDRELSLGNKFAACPDRLTACPDRHDRTFEYVLSATSDPYPLTTHHHPLIDGPGNEWNAFEGAVDDARRLYERDGSLLVHCKAGISRSSTIIATTLAAEDGLGFHDALAIVQEARPIATPHPALHELAVVYLAANG